MLPFIEILLSNSTHQEAKLYGPSEKAIARPDTGIIIQNPGAYHVIKDCARLANGYIPLYVFEHYLQPFETLKGKVKIVDLQQIVEASVNDVFLRHLVVVMVNKAITLYPQYAHPDTVEVAPTQVALELDYTPFDSTQERNSPTAPDPYGVYGITDSDVKYESALQQIIHKNTTPEYSLNILIKAFDCKV